MTRETDQIANGRQAEAAVRDRQGIKAQHHHAQHDEMTIHRQKHQGRQHQVELAHHRRRLAVHGIHQSSETQAGLHGDDLAGHHEALHQELGHEAERDPDEQLLAQHQKTADREQLDLGHGGSKGAIIRVSASARLIRTRAGVSRLPNTAITISSPLTRANGQTMEDNHP